VGTMASGAPIAISVLAARGGGDGPTLWINGQVHGNEMNGLLAALDFFGELDAKSLTGNVVVSTTANPLALDARVKFAPQDQQDLDQTFPGDLGSLTSDRMSRALFAEVRACATTVVSMHTMPALYAAEPYGVYKLHPDGGVVEADLLRMIGCFGVAHACHMGVASGQGELPGNIPGALDYQCQKAGIPAFMIELGSGGVENRRHVRQGTDGFHGVAATLGMTAGPAPCDPDSVMRVRRRFHLTCDRGGLFRRAHDPGDIVPAGTPLGAVQTLHGETVERATWEKDLLVIGIRSEPVVHTGDRLAFVAEEWLPVSLRE
jgi:predicted deacylase